MLATTAPDQPPSEDASRRRRRVKALVIAAVAVGREALSPRHWTIVTPVRASELSEAQRRQAAANRDIPLP